MKTKLPTAAKVIGIICLVGGLWNGLLGLCMLLFFDPSKISMFGPEDAKPYAILAITMLGWYFAAFAVAFLRQRPVGRKGILVGLGLLMTLLLISMVGSIVYAPKLFTFVGAFLGIGFWGAILYLGFRYLRKEAVIEAFKVEPGDEANLVQR